MAEANKKALLGLGLAHLAVDWYASILVPLYPMITSKLGMNLSSISAIIALAHMSSSMFQPFFGFISEHLRHRTFLFWGVVLAAVFTPIAAIANHPVLFMLFLIIAMCGNATFHPQVSCLVNTFSNNNPKIVKYMGIFLGLGTIGYAIGPVCSSTLVDNFGVHALLYTAVAGIIIAICAYFFVPKIPNESICVNHDKFFAVMKDILKTKSIQNLVIIAVIKAATSISFGTYAPFIFKKYGFSLELIGLVVTLFFISSAIGTIVSAKIEQKIGAARIIKLSFYSILPLVGLFLYLLKINPYFAIPVFMLIGFFTVLSVSVTLVTAQRIMSGHKGVVSGVMQGFSWGLGSFFLAPLGFLADYFFVEIVLIVMGVVGLLTGMFVISKDLRKELSSF